MGSVSKADTEVKDLIVQIDELGSSLRTEDGTININDRRKLQDLAMKLHLAAEEPGEIVDRILYSVGDLTFIRIATDLKLFGVLNKSNVPLSSSELASKTSCDPVLMGRILRGLSSIYLVDEAGPDAYIATKGSRAFATTKGISGAQFFPTLYAAWGAVPPFLAANGYKNPSVSLHSPWQTVLGEGPIFKWMIEHPEIMGAFNTFMTSQREGHINWLDFYDFKGDVLDGFDESTGPLFVDVGGGRGHEIIELKSRFPDVKGRLVLQDLPPTIAEVEADEKATSTGLEAMAHDFFTEQPIKDARVYYLRNVIHDWADEQADVILARLQTAMKPGYSKLLLNEFVTPLSRPCHFVTHSDLNMMAVLSSSERTQDQWEKLLARAGLRLSKIWTKEQESESIIVCVRDA